MCQMGPTWTPSMDYDVQAQIQQEKKMLTKEEWIERCAKRYVSAGAFETVADAMGFAEACWDADQDSHDFSEHPEDAADEDMSYWTDDGE